MVIREIIQRVLSAYSKGVQSDDVRLTKRHIYNKLLTTRALLLSREAKQKRKISNWNYVTLPCVEIIEVPYNEECPCIPTVGCNMYRSKYKLPRPIISLVGHMIKSITSLDKNIKFTEMTLNQSIYSSGSKYAKKTNRYILENGYLYIESPTPPIIVRVEILPEDVVEARNFINYCNPTEDTCLVDILETDFPIDGSLIDALIQLTYEELITGFQKSLQDSTNDSRDNAISGFKPTQQPQENRDEQQ